MFFVFKEPAPHCFILFPMASTPRNNVSKSSRYNNNAFRTDMFGRVKVSEPYTFLDSQHRYKRSGDFSDEVVGAGSSVTYDQNASLLNLNVGTASGDKVTLESTHVYPYQPGKSLQVMQTFTFGAPKANLRQRVGFFSRTNGFFLEQDGASIYFVRRSYSSGSLVETRVPQSEWNVDPLDGTGPTDVSLDLTKSQILFSEYEWLGVGSVRIGFAIDGNFIVCHQFNHANHITGTYMTTACLPVRWEIENTGATESASTLKQICTSVVSNGGYETKANPYIEFFKPDASNITVGTDWVYIGAMRLHPDRMDAIVYPGELTITPTASGIFEYEFVHAGTVTGGTWLDHPSGTVQLNRTFTGMSGGVRMDAGIINASNQASITKQLDDVDKFLFQLGRTNSATPVSETYALRIRTLSSNSSVNGTFRWYELF